MIILGFLFNALQENLIIPIPYQFLMQKQKILPRHA